MKKSKALEEFRKIKEKVCTHTLWSEEFYKFVKKYCKDS